MKALNLTKGLVVVLLGLLIVVNVSLAGDSKKAEIKTSAICGMCKKTIEKGLNKLDGVQKASLDVKTKVATVEYNPKKTNIDKIRKAIANTGYDADKVKANKKAYAKLMGCCKKPEDR